MIPNSRSPLDSRYDVLFKDLITAGWNVKSDGNVEAPSGHFAIVEIPSHPGELLEMQNALDSVDYDWPEPGWYFCVENDLGQIFAYSVTKEEAEEMYVADQLALEYWYEAEDEGVGE